MTSAERPRIPGQALRLLPFFLVIFVALSAYRLSRPAPEAAGFEDKEGPQTFSGSTMGTTFSVKVVDPLTVDEAKAVAAAVRKALFDVNQSMSTYDPESELSRFNRSQTVDTPFPISDALRAVLTIAFQVGRESGGALDITVGPLVDAWGFGPSERGKAPPTDEAIAALKAQVGLDKLELHEEGLVKKAAGVQCDLSAVAKGYAVDRVAVALQEAGLHNFLVEVGGELRASGRRADGQVFRVGVEKPISDGRAVERVVQLADGGMATSGDYRNFFDDHGQRRSHFLDPRTGSPVSHDLASVTVLAPDTATADAWATALSVLGPVEGPKRAAAQKLAAFFIVRDGESGFRSLESPAFAATQEAESP